MKSKQYEMFEGIRELEDKLITLAEQYSKSSNPIHKEKLNNEMMSIKFIMDRKTKALLKQYK